MLLAKAFSLLFSLLCAASGQRDDYFKQKIIGYPWPKPIEYIRDESRTCQVSQLLVFDFGDLNSCDILAAAAQRSFRYIFGNVLDNRMGSHSVLPSAITRVIVRLNAKWEGRLPQECDPTVYPSDEMDESYQADVSCKDAGSTANVTANSITGLIRGIETFTQLTWINDDGDVVLYGAKIDDKPAFPWRGILLDTSRHFLPMSTLLQNLEMMAANKVNVFHWHIIDDQAFPWFSKTFPQLSQKGAYHPAALHSYSPADVKAVIDRARLFGIRVVPEFDTPGHTQSWGAALPEIMAHCYNESGYPTGKMRGFDISSPQLWETLPKIFEEIFQVFPDRYIHLGGDEASYDSWCWLTNPDIKKFMAEKGIKDGEQLQNYYTARQVKMLDTLSQNKGRYVFWQEVFDNKIELPQGRAVSHVWWQNQSGLVSITKAGLHGLFSSCWYLDHLHDWATGPLDWNGYYACDPLAFPMEEPEKQRKLVLGGEACLWGEYVDSVNVLSQLWPRASAFAERLWSDPRSDKEKDPNSGLPKAIKPSQPEERRLEAHRCRMVGRGFPAQPVLGPGFCENEYRAM